MKRLVVLFVLVFSLAGCSQLKGWLDAPADSVPPPAPLPDGTPAPKPSNSAVLRGLLGSVADAVLSPEALGGGLLGSVLYPTVVRPLRRRREASKAKP